MIAKTKTGNGFSGLASYQIEKEDAQILHQNNVFTDDPKELGRQFRKVAGNSISKPVWHSFLSFADSDKVSDERMVEIAERFLKEMGFSEENHQFAILKHLDSPNQHLHIIANRVGIDGTVVSDSFYKTKTVNVAKKLEKEFGLVVAQDIRNTKLLRINPENVNPEKLAKNYIKAQVNLHIRKVNSLEDLAERLKADKVDMQIHRHETGNVYGVSFGFVIPEGKKKHVFKFKGSQVGKEYTVKSILSRLKSIKTQQKAVLGKNPIAEQKTPLYEKPITNIEEPSIADIFDSMPAGLVVHQEEEEPKKKKKKKRGQSSS